MEARDATVILSVSKEDEMHYKQMGIAIATLAAPLLALGGAANASPHATLTIRHQVRGCHAWSYNASPYAAAQTVAVRPGTTVTVVDNDIMPHMLVQNGGARVTLSGAAMARIG